jgi:hypothetical protein
VIHIGADLVPSMISPSSCNGNWVWSTSVLVSVGNDQFRGSSATPPARTTSLVTGIDCALASGLQTPVD